MLRASPFSGIGLNQDEPFAAGDRDWYGGRVHFAACVRKDKSGHLKLDLEQPTLGSSDRFARRFGSQRFIRVRIQQDLFYKAVGDELKDYFRRPFIIGRAVFCAFYAKEASVFLFRTNEVVGRNSSIVQPAPESAAARSGLSLLDFVKWHNDPQSNQNQVCAHGKSCHRAHLTLLQLMTKWAARVALGKANSVPGVRLESIHIHLIYDIGM